MASWLGSLRRPYDGRVAGGVAAGLAERTGFSAGLIRLGFVIAALAGGFGALAYVVAWLFIPAAGEQASIAHAAGADRRGIALAVAVASVLAVVLTLASFLRIGWLGPLSWLYVAAAAGLVLIWRNAPAPEQTLLRAIVEPVFGTRGRTGRTRIVVRAALGLALLVSGLAVLLPLHVKPALFRPLSGSALVLAAVVVLLGPWWLRVLRDLLQERQARIRAEERAEVASRVHDSVLQTLALIQRRAHDPNQVISLARAQERELRSWLFDGAAPDAAGQATTVAAGVRQIQQEVEAKHGIVVEAITVGDCDLDDDLGALIAAAREATVNAAKWSGARSVSVFAEVEPGSVSVFVRDRGRGFDPAAVPADRKGLAESVRARMTRRGGSATIKSEPGDGTEVALTMPRAAAPREPSPAR